MSLKTTLPKRPNGYTVSPKTKHMSTDIYYKYILHVHTHM